MKRTIQLYSAALCTLLISLSMIVSNVQAQRRPYHMNDRQVEALLTRIEENSERFRKSLDDALDESRRDGTAAEDEINSFVRDFVDAVEDLRERFDDRRSVAADVEDVLTKARRINVFMNRYRLTKKVQRDWARVRSELRVLANTYGVNWRQ